MLIELLEIEKIYTVGTQEVPAVRGISMSVADGDYPLKVAEQYDVEVEALDAANATNPAYSQWIPGQTIVIPAKADC